MLTNWTAGLDDQTAKDVTTNFGESKVTRRRLCEILTSKIEECRTTARSKTTYDNPNWSFKQADCIGYERALTGIIKYLQD